MPSVVHCINATASTGADTKFLPAKKKKKKTLCQLLQVKKNSNMQAHASTVALSQWSTEGIWN